MVGVTELDIAALSDKVQVVAQEPEPEQQAAQASVIGRYSPPHWVKPEPWAAGAARDPVYASTGPCQAKARSRIPTISRRCIT